MLILRQVHTYFGMFIAPSLLFFALTGAIQLFSLHEPHGDYHPPAIIEKLGMLHKKQVFAVRAARGPGRGAAAQGGHAARDQDHAAGRIDHDKGAGRPKPAHTLSKTLLQYFFLLVCFGLVLSTLVGMWLGVRYTRRKRLAWGLLIAGVVVPVALLFV